MQSMLFGHAYRTTAGNGAQWNGMVRFKEEMMMDLLRTAPRVHALSSGGELDRRRSKRTYASCTEGGSDMEKAAETNGLTGEIRGTEPNKPKQMARNSELCRDISARPTAGKMSSQLFLTISSRNISCLCLPVMSMGTGQLAGRPSLPLPSYWWTDRGRARNCEWVPMLAISSTDTFEAAERPSTCHPQLEA